ncbi:MAG: glycoside hydrolase 100 family protein [Flavobacteriaceae bacterium]
MEHNFNPLYQKAIALLHDLTTKEGLLASTIEADNYKRIWARDSIICGLAGLWIGDPILIEGLKNSLLSLATAQNAQGMIPSNVLPHTDDVSFGSLVGRIDANTWFIVGSCLYYEHTKDETAWEILKPCIQKCRLFLKAIEMNAKGWLYTPLSGNWADEYPIHGYTLYDNVLRLWGEQLWGTLTNEKQNGFELLIEKTKTNFWPSTKTEEKLRYQPLAFEKALQKKPKHFGAFILPGIYDLRFDAAGNALALLFFNMEESQKMALSEFVATLPNHLVPAFWPMTTPESDDWYLLEDNYSFSFKNYPGDFHNGGIWPVWMGLFSLGLAQHGCHKAAKKIVVSFINILSQNPRWDFHEYLNANTLEPGGKTKMGYTASGIVFMKLAMELAV